MPFEHCSKRITPPSIQLKEIFHKDIYKELYAVLSKTNWKHKAIYDIFSYWAAPAPSALRSILRSPAFRKIVSAMTGEKLHHIQFELCLFQHENYTLLQDKMKPAPGIVFQLEFTPLWNPSWGGYTDFVKRKEELLGVNPMPNALVLVKQDKDMKSFIKYVNHRAGSRKRFVVRGMLCLFP